MTTDEMVAEIKRMDDGHWDLAFNEAGLHYLSYMLTLLNKYGGHRVPVGSLRALYNEMRRTIELGGRDLDEEESVDEITQEHAATYFGVVDAEAYLDQMSYALTRLTERPELHNTVDHPAHYTQHPSGVECIQITEHMGFNLGNAIKYIWRADLKHDAIEDLRKAAWYVNREIELRSKL